MPTTQLKAKYLTNILGNPIIVPLTKVLKRVMLYNICIGCRHIYVCICEHIADVTVKLQGLGVIIILLCYKIL